MKDEILRASRSPIGTHWPSLTFRTPSASIGERIHAIRRHIEMKQETLAQLCRVSRVWISYLETGKKNATSSLLRVIAESLGCGLHDLIYRSQHIDITIGKPGKCFCIDCEKKLK